jgi:hypothetical protein
MRRAFLALALGGLLASSASHAQPYPGLALRWNHCFGEGSGLASRSFSCDTNAGFEELVGSFVLTEDMPEVSGVEIIVDLTTQAPYQGYLPAPAPDTPLPEWWKYKQPGTCRQTSLTFSTAPDPGDQVCVDWGAGLEVGALANYQIDFRGTGSARITAAAAVPMTNPQSLQQGIEYYAFTLRIRHDKTVGAGACGGCDVRVWLYLDGINVVTPRLEDNRRLAGPLNGVDSDLAQWGLVPVATRATTWSALKSRFR